MKLTSDQKRELAVVAQELREQEKQEAIRLGKERGRVLDQIELSYRQYSPPQIEDYPEMIR